MRLEGKVILVTGATGIAAAGARRFSAEGASVFVVSRSSGEAQALASTLDVADWHAADLREEGATEEAVASARDRFSRIDGLFAVAGGSGRQVGDGPVHQIPLAGWDATIAMNLTPTFLAVRETVRAMLSDGGGGSIALVSSVLASSPSPELFATHAYAAAKGAQLSLMLAVASYYAKDRIRVNAIAPGLVDTPMSRRAAEDPATTRYTAIKQPLVSGMLDSVDIAQAATYLLSDEARAVTGQVLTVDGGWSVSEGPS